MVNSLTYEIFWDPETDSELPYLRIYFGLPKPELVNSLISEFILGSLSPN
jgi:hypothetical protein